MLVSLTITYTHAQDSLGNVITRTTIVILQQTAGGVLFEQGWWEHMPLIPMH